MSHDSLQTNRFLFDKIIWFSGKNELFCCKSYLILLFAPQFSNASASAETEGCRPVDSEILLSLQKDILPPPVDVTEDENRYAANASSDLERDIARILEEQALVTRRAGEIEKALAGQGQQQQQQPSAKVGFAAVQEMARLQERALLGSEVDEDEPAKENIITFDPAANCLQLKQPANSAKTVGGLGKFPLEVPSSPIARSPPAASARVGLRRMGSQR